jgi:outer membrane protein OmpA-like peptidoglycan-associated protein
MRVSSVLALIAVVCAAPAWSVMAQPSDSSNVTVDLGALPVPMPRFKPTPEEMRPLAAARPRPKPGSAMSPIGDDAVPADAIPAAAPADATTALTTIPMPRWKPGSEVAVVAAAPPAAATPVAPAAAPAVQPAAPPPGPPAAPVTIVGKPVTDETFPVEITGVAQDPIASRTPIDPTAGFSILSRVRFSKNGSSLSPQAHRALDTLAERLLSSRERVKLAAFSGKIGGDSSQARRLSLTRALAIRNYLVSKGVPVDRVDVLAFGGPATGVTDRVDVLVRAI